MGIAEKIERRYPPYAMKIKEAKEEINAVERVLTNVKKEGKHPKVDSTFMGVDQRIYKLKRGDVLYLPKINVELLMARSVAAHSKGRLTDFEAENPECPRIWPPYKSHRRKKKEPASVTLTERDKWLLSGNYHIQVGNRWIAPMLKPAKGGGQMEFR